MEAGTYQVETSDEFLQRLRDANAEQLAAALVERRDAFDVPAARAVLRNPYVSGEMIETLLSVGRLAAFVEIRRDAAGHPRTPVALALALVESLFWADLVRIGVDSRLHPIVRRAADRRIVERLAALAVGEKMAIARAGSPTLLAALRHDPSPRVVGALLENPRLTEGLLLPLVAAQRAAPLVLALVAASPKWAVRYPIRVALCRNAQTPVGSSLALLPNLKKSDLEAVASDAGLSGAVRGRARLLAGGGRREDYPLRGRAGPV